MDTSKEVALLLKRGVEALRAERLGEAIFCLTDVANNPDLAAAEDLQDIRARACSLAAQALHLADQQDEARPFITQALRITKGLNDLEGLKEIQSLNAEILQAQKAKTQAEERNQHLAGLVGTAPETLLEGIGNPFAQVERLLELLTAEVSMGTASQAMVVSEQLLTLADELKHSNGSVMGRLQMARLRAPVHPAAAKQLLLQALAIAQQRDEFNLVSTVAHAAGTLNITLPVQQGPEMGR